MVKIHEFISKHVRFLKWLPWVNSLVLTYYLIRETIITRKSPRFLWVIKVMGISAGAALAAAFVSQYVLPRVFTTMTGDQLLDRVMPVVVTFVVIPAFIGMLVKADMEN